MMDNLVTVNGVELERLLIAIETSLHVHRRSQYFLWTQGIVQSFLAHDALIFGRGDYDTPGFSWEILARSNSWEEQELLRQMSPVVLAMLDAWRRGGQTPCLFLADENAQDEIGGNLFRLGLGHALAHGSKEFSGESSGFFIFLRMPEAPGKRQVYFAQILMPYLHSTLHRMLRTERNMPVSRRTASSRLSARELEVITLIRDGCTNQQIATQLELSPLTIKNHVQNILRKLSVANRAQAVAKVLNGHLIEDGAAV